MALIFKSNDITMRLIFVFHPLSEPDLYGQTICRDRTNEEETNRRKKCLNFFLTRSGSLFLRWTKQQCASLEKETFLIVSSASKLGGKRWKVFIFRPLLNWIFGQQNHEPFETNSIELLRTKLSRIELSRVGLNWMLMSYLLACQLILHWSVS